MPSWMMQFKEPGWMAECQEQAEGVNVVDSWNNVILITDVLALQWRKISSAVHEAWCLGPKLDTRIEKCTIQCAFGTGQTVFPACSRLLLFRPLKHTSSIPGSVWLPGFQWRCQCDSVYCRKLFLNQDPVAPIQVTCGWTFRLSCVTFVQTAFS